METIVIIVIVLVVALLVGRTFYRTLTGKTGCGCSGGSCGDNDNCDELSKGNSKQNN